jgi:formylglycine-generating enzyme required for sulfatase activity
LPVRVILRNVAAHHLPPMGQPANANHLLNYLQGALDDATLGDYFEALTGELRQTGGLILLDGLDEVPEADQRRVQIKQMVENFVGVFSKCRYLVTSRTYAYQNEDWQLADFADTTLEALQPAQIHAFVKGWYTRIAPLRSLSAADAQARAELLNHAIDQNERLRPLAEQPLLLTLMTNLHAFRGGSLPEKREQLYAAAVDLLLDWWERQRVVYGEGQSFRVVQPSLLEYLKVGKDAILQALGELAYTMHKSNPSPEQSAIIRQPELVDALLNASPDRDLQPRQLIDHLSVRTGLLIADGNRIFKFPHRTFQEYLAALHLTGSSYPDEVAELARNDPNRWREVLLLAAAHAAAGTESPAWEVAEALFPNALAADAYQTPDYWGVHLAGLVLQENINLAQLRPRNQAKLERIRHGLLQVMQHSLLPALERAHAGRTLAWLGDPRPEVMTIARMQFCYVPPGDFYQGAENQRVSLAYGYWISRFPVTNAQFAEFVAAAGYGDKRYWAEAIQARYWSQQGFQGLWDNEPRSAPVDYGLPFTLPNHPVVGVSWYEAVAFCCWLSEQLNSGVSAPSGQWQVRLPLETEWEKAAHGGLQIPEQPQVCTLGEPAWPAAQPPALKKNHAPYRRYPPGDDFGPELANFAETGIHATNAVGCFARGASPYGVEELSGNVWEWLWQEPGDIAGGAYYSSLEEVTSAARRRHDPHHRHGPVGFRCVVVSISRS